MNATQMLSTRKMLQSPRAAAVAGILFAVLYGASLIIIRLSIPDELTADRAIWLETHSERISLALSLVPYAGIAFLWFIGVIRDHLGDQEDRLFATVFLGSGLLFLALSFSGAALAGGLMSSYAIESQNLVDSGVFTYGRSVMFQIINVYAIRMAGVFMISLGTIWFRTRLMHRGLAILTYLLALTLLLSINLSLWVNLIFPGWVLLISTIILIRNLVHQAPDEIGEGNPS